MSKRIQFLIPCAMVGLCLASAVMNLPQGVAADLDHALAADFQRQVAPFLRQHCERCHNADEQTSGVRVDQLDAALADRHLKLWEGVRRQIQSEGMPPKDEDQPSAKERAAAVAWIDRALHVARSRPIPKNGGARRLTVAQYRNTLRELLQLEDDLAEVLPPDAVSRDGFVNNQETLALSPLLVEAYLDIADKALRRVIVDPRSQPTIQNFRVDLGRQINDKPCPDRLILGADSLLLDNSDFVVSELTPIKPFPFTPHRMPTKLRYIEGYRGNDTVRGWRDFESVYHSIFACMRGTHGYPKGRAYSTIPEGLLLRPAMPSAELFGVESTYGPRANFKISLRELPDEGKFKVTVVAAKYADGLLLDPTDAPAARREEGTQGSDEKTKTIVVGNPGAATEIQAPESGIYQIDVHLAQPETKLPTPDTRRLDEQLVGYWPLDGAGAADSKLASLTVQPVGDAKFEDSPFGKAVTLDGNGDSFAVPRDATMNVGEGDFSVAAWIHPRELKQAGIVCLGKYAWTNGWYLDMPNNQGVLRIETAGPDNAPNGTVASPPGTIKANVWQHVAAVVRRGENATELFVNGYRVARGTIGPKNLDNPKVSLHIGRIQDAQGFRGAIDDVRFYRRALTENEIQAFVEPGRRFVSPPPKEKPHELLVDLGEREFAGVLQSPAFLAVRLDAGPVRLHARYAGNTPVDRLELTRLTADSSVARRFLAFEGRSPRVGVHIGLRRDCGSTLSQVQGPRTVSSTKPTAYVFEGAIRNFPSPDVEKDNVNYLAGLREIGVRSEYTDGRDMPRMLVKSVEFEGPYYDAWPPASHRAIFRDDLRRDDPREHAREVISEFAARAFRRPVSDSELTALMKIYDASAASGASFEASVRDSLQVVLASPQFLMLVEQSQSPAPEPLDDYELASKLSYFLWNGPPDARLCEKAAAGKLRERLDEEVSRMIADPRFDRFSHEFTTQWLALDKFAVLEPDRGKFPGLTRDVRTQLAREPVELVEYLIRENLSVRHLISSEFVLANEVVASYYDLGDRTESGFEFVAIPHQRRDLGGVLSQAAVLAGLSDGREPNPVKRGAWLARRIVAEPPDDPPPNVPALKEEEKQLTLRQKLEKHRSQVGCAQCHARIDPWGVPFEEYDAGGRLRTQTVDARSTLPDQTEVAGFEELRKYLAEDRLDQVAFSVLKHLSIYASGRSLAYNETAQLKRDAVKLKASGYRMQDMVRFVVQSPVFLEK
jgi:mono/diheme cytochrome c family protein